MPILVGDVVMAVRSLIPDVPGTLPTPLVTSLIYTVVPVAGSTLPANTYRIRLSSQTNWGESLASSESADISIPVSNTSGIQLSGTLPLGATSIRVYFGSAGNQNQYVVVTSLPYVISAPGAPGILPTVGRAYLPDTDGAQFPAVTVFGWLRDGLSMMGDLTDGIYDATGVCTVNTYGMYALLNQWKRMSHGWVDGWPFGQGNKGEIYYRNKVTTSGSGIAVLDIRSSQSIIEYYPVPARNGGVTTTTAPITATSTTIPATTLSGYLLKYGLALLSDTSGNTEIVAFQSFINNQLVGCLRGVGGTVPQAWASGVTLSELNGRFAGYRYPRLPRVGESSYNLDLPPTWDAILQLFVESRWREAERRFKEAKDLRSTFQMECKTIGNQARNILGPRQTGETLTNEVYNVGLGGGWLLP